MALKPQDQFDEVLEVTIDDYFNLQVNGIGNQKKAKVGAMPFAIETGQGAYNWQDATTDSSKGDGQTWFSTNQNNVIVGANLTVYISNIDELGDEYGTAFLAAVAGDRFTMIETLDKGYRFEMTAPATAGTDYVRCPVTVIDDLGDNFAKNVRVKIEGDAASATPASEIKRGMNEFLGWALFDDLQWTSTSPLLLDSSNSFRSPLKVDGYGPRTNTDNWTGDGDWNGANGQMQPESDNEIWIVQTQATVRGATGAGMNVVDLEVYLPAATTTIFRESKVIQEGGSAETHLAWSFEMESSPELLAGGAEFKLQSNGKTVELYNLNVYFRKAYEG